MEIPFEPTRSYAYKFSRYIVLAELQALPETSSGERFLLRDLAWPIIDKHLSPEQQAIPVKKAQSDVYEPLGRIVRFFVQFLTKRLNVFENLGEGYFRGASESDTLDSQLEDAAIDAGDEDAEDLKGYIYAFSFPSIVKNNTPFPIKVGKTTGDVTSRVIDQCKGSATFERPIVLESWLVERVGPTETAIHNILKARGKHREDAPGREWFNTTLEEVQQIVRFIGQRDQ